MPRASLRSVLLICAFSTARMCRVSTQITGKPASARTTRKHCSSKVSKPRLQRGIDKARVDLLIEFIDDLGGRFLRRANALQRARLVPRHEVTYGRDVWQYLRTRCGRHRQRT